MPQSNLGKVYKIQGPNGPVAGKRPSDADLVKLRGLDAPLGERTKFATDLAKAGFVIDATIDVDGWDYWKTMGYRRQYGYTWVPTALMGNITIAPGLWMPAEHSEDGIRYDPNPPQGAILIPRTEIEDPNYNPPKVVPAPPPAPADKVVFGVTMDVPVPGSYDGTGSTVFGQTAAYKGKTYTLIRIVISPFAPNGNAVWVPVEG